MNIEEYHNSKKLNGKSSFAYECCGCGACKSICPKQCISMNPNEEGFLFPVVDHINCID